MALSYAPREHTLTPLGQVLLARDAGLSVLAVCSKLTGQQCLALCCLGTSHGMPQWSCSCHCIFLGRHADTRHRLCADMLTWATICAQTVQTC